MDSRPFRIPSSPPPGVSRTPAGFPCSSMSSSSTSDSSSGITSGSDSSNSRAWPRRPSLILSSQAAAEFTASGNQSLIQNTQHTKFSQAQFSTGSSSCSRARRAGEDNCDLDEQQVFLLPPVTSSTSSKSSRRCGCCSSAMNSKINTCLGTLLAICTCFILMTGSCLVAAGVLFLLQMKVDSEPFGLGAKLREREEGGSHFVLIFESVAWLLTALGVLLALIGFSGCTGSFGRVHREYKVLGKVFLVTFIFLVLTVLITTLTLAIFAIVFQDSIRDRLKSELSDSMETYKGERSSHPSSLFWNFLQLKLECCGVEQAEDWALSENWRRQQQNQSWPYVCCHWEGRDLVTLKVLDTSGVPRPRYTEWEQCYSQTNSIYQKGCGSALEEQLMNNLTPISLGVVVFLLTDLICILVAVILCRHQDYNPHFSLNFMET